MVIITWNANDRNRWPHLWQDPFVGSFNWDVICLQEAGNPDPNWHKTQGPQWGTNPNKQDAVFRLYTYTTLLGNPVFIIHCEWVNHQKNHTVLITKAPARPINMAGDVGIRPCLGIQIRLIFPNHTTKTVLLGNVHIISGFTETKTKQEYELSEMMQYIKQMVAYTRSDGWMLFGDFNAPPLLVEQITKGKVTSPKFPTQMNQKEYPLDFGVFSDASLMTAGSSNWYPGQSKSDHVLIKYEQIGGPTVTFI